MTNGFRALRRRTWHGNWPSAGLVVGLAGMLMLGACTDQRFLWFGPEGPASPQGAGEAALSIALPSYHPGDVFVYEEAGRRVRVMVVAVDDHRITWADDKGERWEALADPSLLPLSETARPGAKPLVRTYPPGTTGLFPLWPGKRDAIALSETAPGAARPRFAYERCEAREGQTIVVEAGSFLAYPIVCRRDRGRETLYYAPSIQAVVLKRRETAHGEVVASLTSLDTAAAGAVGPGAASPPGTAPAAARNRAAAMLEPALLPTSRTPPDLLLPAARGTAGAAAPATRERRTPPLAISPALQARLDRLKRSEAAPIQPLYLARGDGFAVQLGAYADNDDAQAAWHEVRARLPELLGNLQSMFRPFRRADGKAVVRLVVGPFSEEDAANDLCHRLHKAGQDCWVHRPAVPGPRSGA